MLIVWPFIPARNNILFTLFLTNEPHTLFAMSFTNIALSQLMRRNVVMAATPLAALWALPVHILLGGYFLRGWTVGALKGWRRDRKFNRSDGLWIKY